MEKHFVIDCENKQDLLLDVLRVLSLKKSELMSLEIKTGSIYLRVKHWAGCDQNDIAKTLQLLPGINKVKEVDGFNDETMKQYFYSLLEYFDTPFLLLGKAGEVKFYNLAAGQLLNLTKNQEDDEKKKNLVVNAEIKAIIDKAVQTSSIQCRNIALEEQIGSHKMFVKPLYKNGKNEIGDIALIIHKKNGAQEDRSEERERVNWDEQINEMLKNGLSLAEIMEMFEKKVLNTAINNCGSARKTAKLLGVSHTTILNKLNKYGDLEEYMNNDSIDSNGGEANETSSEVGEEQTAASNKVDFEIRFFLQEKVHSLTSKGQLQDKSSWGINNISASGVDKSYNTANEAGNTIDESGEMTYREDSITGLTSSLSDSLNQGTKKQSEKKSRKCCSNCGAELKYGAVFCPNCFQV